MNNWVAYHIFNHDFKQHNDLIILLSDQAKKNLAEGSIDKWFFLRYWEGGPHIRFRVLNPTIETKMNFQNIIQSFVSSNSTDVTLTKEQYFKDHLFDGEALDKDTLEWHENGEVRTYEYNPEYERYGGEHVMKFSESIFMLSSELVRLLLVKRKSFSHNLIYSAIISNILLKELYSCSDQKNLSNDLDFNINFWETFKSSNEDELLDFFEKNNSAIEKLTNQILIDEETGKLLHKIKEQMNFITSKGLTDDSIKTIIFSHVHMTNNRLGASPPYERAILIWVKRHLKEYSERGSKQ
ncbi:thiopeptide-type bacteriocin biosynthesis protein [Shouchella sp. 1P09AA]|uniref:thiopeptide-type bacteriocin biosynthesis protein n=1 Tax=unclassified Shouchella TaxID=2893065 RepID=UPI00399F8861